MGTKKDIDPAPKACELHSQASGTSKINVNHFHVRDGVICGKLDNKGICSNCSTQVL